MNKFKVGDLVKAWGLKGKVVHYEDYKYEERISRDTVNTIHVHSVTVKFEDGSTDTFFPCGKYQSHHKQPTLEFQ